MDQVVSEKGPIAILVVHGIGAQRRGETAGKLLAGLGRVERGLAAKGQDGVLTVGGQAVRLYEVYWADLLQGDVTRGAFQLKELQSLSWFPFFNWRRGNYQKGNYSILKLAWPCVALPIMNFFLLFAYYGAGFVANVVSSVMAKRGAPENDPAARPTVREVAKQSAKLTALDRILDEYLGDIFSYVNSAGKAFDRDEHEPPVPSAIIDVYPRIIQRFHDQLVQAHADGCAAIQIVAHSLGTVVTYHALSRLQFESRNDEDAGAIRAASAKVQHLYTIGSPLEKIRFFWPRLMPEGVITLGGENLRWDNFVSWFDPVAGMLQKSIYSGALTNHRLLGGGFFRGHVVYEHSAVFLKTFTHGLIGRELPLERTRKERWQDLLLLVGETLVAPVALVVLLMVGAALYVMAVLLVPFVISLGLRLFLKPETWSRIEDTASFIFLGCITLTFLITPILRANRVHSLYWVRSSSESGARGGNT